MIQIREIKEPTVYLYWYGADPTKGELIGEIKNQLQMLDIRVQIKEEQSDKYGIYWENDAGGLIMIDKDGQLESYPIGLYDDALNMLNKLFL